MADTQIFLMHSDGSGLRQLTRNGTNLWPTFLNNKRILFTSNGILANGTFNIFAVNIDGSELEQVWNSVKFVRKFFTCLNFDKIQECYCFRSINLLCNLDIWYSHYYYYYYRLPLIAIITIFILLFLMMVWNCCGAGTLLMSNSWIYIWH